MSDGDSFPSITKMSGIIVAMIKTGMSMAKNRFIPSANVKDYRGEAAASELIAPSGYVSLLYDLEM
ncbi:MAG: hypothetical protein ACPGSB_12520 [Opitutales bacterium]